MILESKNGLGAIPVRYRNRKCVANCQKVYHCISHGNLSIYLDILMASLKNERPKHLCSAKFFSARWHSPIMSRNLIELSSRLSFLMPLCHLIGEAIGLKTICQKSILSIFIELAHELLTIAIYPRFSSSDFPKWWATNISCWDEYFVFFRYAMTHHLHLTWYAKRECICHFFSAGSMTQTRFGIESVVPFRNMHIAGCRKRKYTSDHLAR